MVRKMSDSGPGWVEEGNRGEGRKWGEHDRFIQINVRSSDRFRRRIIYWARSCSQTADAQRRNVERPTQHDSISLRAHGDAPEQGSFPGAEQFKALGLSIGSPSLDERLAPVSTRRQNISAKARRVNELSRRHFSFPSQLCVMETSDHRVGLCHGRAS